MSRPEPVHYPVALDLRERRVLLVGAGTVATRKLDGLLEAGALVHVVAPEVDDRIEERRDEIDELSRRPYAPSDLDGVWFVVEATGDAALAAEIAADAEEAGVFCNAADLPDSCSAILPAVHRQGGLTVTWSTGGRSPAYASWLRAQAPHLYGPEHARLLELVTAARAEMRDRGQVRSAADWRELLDSGILEEIRTGRLERAKERLQAWQSSSSE